MSAQSEKNDVTIVGAGFAGLSCARVAAGNGLKTLVLERKQCPGDNIRTTGILVKEAADILKLPPHLGREIRGVRLYSPNGKWVDLESPGYSFVATDTPAMMRWMADRAILAGAEIRCNENASEFAETGDRIHLPQQQIKTKFLVGCDGARSNVARKFSLGINRKFLMGVEAEYTGIADIATDKLHVFLDSVLAPGYIGWAVPGVGITQVGLAVRKSHKPDLAAFERRIRDIFDFRNADVVARRGGLIPCGGVVKNWQRDNIMLLGDAAGMVSPLTAGGIHPSIEIGERAGEALTEYLKHRGKHPASQLRDIIPAYRTKGLMRLTMDHATPPNFLYNCMLGNPLFRSIAQIVFFHHRGLFSPAAWRDILLHRHHRSGAT